MSITVVSSLPKVATANPSEASSSASASAGNENAGQLDFMSLLLSLGQQFSAPTTALASDTKDASEALETKASDNTTTDPNALFAALGIIPPDTKPQIKSSEASAGIASTRTEAGAEAARLPAVPLSESGRSTDTVTLDEATPRATPFDPAKFAGKAVAGEAGTTATKQEHSTEGLVAMAPQANAEALSKMPQAVHETTSTTIQTPVRSSGWNHDFGQKIVWLASNEKQSAQITLNPEQMGPIEVSLSVDKGNVSASFTSANAEVREAIETALPRLREMFASAGIELGQTNVSAESFRQPTPERDNQGRPSPGTGGTGILAPTTAAPAHTGGRAVLQGNGLVDTFA